jgi:hypothetical protein
MVMEVEVWEEVIESGIPKEYIDEYLRSLGGEECGHGLYRDEDWEIQIQEDADRCFGKLRLPVNRVIFRGEKSRCLEMVAKFRLKFLSAGD